MSKRVFTQTFGVAGAILEKNGKILLVREDRHSKGVDFGKWNHPAGWIEVGENPIEAVVREVLEEGGHKFEPTALLGVYSLVRQDLKEEFGSSLHPIKLIFKGRIKNEDPHTLHDDVTATRWFSPKEIYDMDSKTLRDVDIKQMVKDYFAGKEVSLESLVHTVQD